MITLVSNTGDKIDINYENMPKDFMAGYFSYCNLQDQYETDFSTNFLKQLKVFSKEGKWPYRFFEVYEDIISTEFNPRTKKGALIEFLGLPLNSGGVPLVKDDHDQYHKIERIKPNVVHEDVSGEFTFITESNKKYVLSWKQLLKYPDSLLTVIARNNSNIGKNSIRTEIPDKIMKMIGGVYSDEVWANFNPFMAENRDIKIGDIVGFDAVCDYLGVPSDYEEEEEYDSADEEYEEECKEYVESLYEDYQKQYEEKDHFDYSDDIDYYDYYYDIYNYDQNGDYDFDYDNNIGNVW